ncbi:MAG: hypothetical protein ACLTEE_11370 [Anaerobutyricum hallii]
MNEIPFHGDGKSGNNAERQRWTFTVNLQCRFSDERGKIFSQEVKIKEYINFMPRVTVILFYAALLGAIKPILNQLSVITDFTVGCKGAPSGWLKNIFDKNLYMKWLQDEEELEISFDDTIRSDILQRKIAQNAVTEFTIEVIYIGKQSKFS